METLVVPHHRNHHRYYGRSRSHGPTKFDSIGSTAWENFTGISCITFESGGGLLPAPLKSFSSPVTKHAYSTKLSPKTPSPTVNENQKCLKTNAKSSTMPMPIKINFEKRGEEFHFSERWAGPAYSISPPPSSLPLPKFSVRPKRTVSLDLPTLASEIDMHPMARSAPASPTRGFSHSPRDLFDSADTATKNLRRMLNLDITDE